MLLTAQNTQTKGKAACMFLGLCSEGFFRALVNTLCSAATLFGGKRRRGRACICRKAEPLGACLAVETCSGRRVRTWARSGADGAPACAAGAKAPGSRAPAYLSALQAFLPDGYPASVTPDYLRAFPWQACSCSLEAAQPGPEDNKLHLLDQAMPSCPWCFGTRGKLAFCRRCKSTVLRIPLHPNALSLVEVPVWRRHMRRLPGMGLGAGAVLVCAGHADLAGAAGRRRRRARGENTQPKQMTALFVYEGWPLLSHSM